MRPKAIVTIPPYAPFIDEVARHPAVEGLRLNVVMPIKDSLEDVLKKLDDAAARRGKDFYVDLKCRQLRVKTFGVPPFSEIELSHNIEVETPVTAYFCDGQEYATVLEDATLVDAIKALEEAQENFRPRSIAIACCRARIKSFLI